VPCEKKTEETRDSAKGKRVALKKRCSIAKEMEAGDTNTSTNRKDNKKGGQDSEGQGRQGFIRRRKVRNGRQPTVAPAADDQGTNPRTRSQDCKEKDISRRKRGRKFRWGRRTANNGNCGQKRGGMAKRVSRKGLRRRTGLSRVCAHSKGADPVESPIGKHNKTRS